MPAFDTPDPVDLVLDTGVARIDIVAADRADSVVTVVPTTPSKPGDVTMAEQTRVEFADGRLSIATPKRWAVLGPGPESVDIRIELPAGSRVRGANQVGDVHIEGRIAEADLAVALGDIVVADGGSLRLKATTGEIVVDRATGAIVLTSSTGGVRVGHLDGSGSIKISTGSAHIGRLVGEVEIGTATGGVTVDTLEGSLVAKTAHGKVRVLDAVRGSIRVEGNHGAVDVTVHPGTAAWLDIAAQRGAVRNELTGSGAPAPGEDTVEIRARTNWGDITIRRGAAT